jgi:hypothetical protein
MFVTRTGIDGGQDSEAESNDLIKRIQGADLEVKKEVFEAALKTAAEHNNGADLIRHAMSTAPTVEIRTAAVGKAVETAANREKEKEIVDKVFREAHPDTLKAAAREGIPSQATLDTVWKLTVGTFALVLGIATVGLFLVIGFDTLSNSRDVSVDPAHLQIMLTVFTTTAGVLAGFITGHAVGKATETGGGNK